MAGAAPPPQNAYQIIQFQYKADAYKANNQMRGN